MTVRAILDTKGHQVVSVALDAKVSAAVKILSERRIGAVLVMNGSRIEGILSERDVVRVLGERGAAALDRERAGADRGLGAVGGVAGAGGVRRGQRRGNRHRGRSP